MRHIWAPWRIGYVAGARVPGCVLCVRSEDEEGACEHVVYRGLRCYVLLNAYPYNSGHLMVVPYAHVADLTDLPGETLAEMMELAQVCIRALRRAMRPDGINLGMNLGKAAGAGIDEHIHLHIVPRWAGDTNFMTCFAEARVVPQSLADTAALLRPLVAEEAGRGEAEGGGGEAGK